MDLIEDLAIQHDESIRAELEIQVEVQKCIHKEVSKKIEQMKDKILKNKQELTQVKKELSEARKENKKFTDIIKKSNMEIIRFFVNYAKANSDNSD